MGLATFVGGAADGVLGFEKGVRDAKADQMTDQRNDLEVQKIGAAKELLPVQTDLIKRKAQSETADLNAADQLRPEKSAAEIASAKFKAATDIHNTALLAMQEPAKTAEVLDLTMEKLASYATSGDKTSFLAGLNQAAKTPLFAAMNNMPEAIDYEVVKAQPGMTDIGGRPIPNSAIKLTHKDGTTSLLNADTMTAAAQRAQQKKDVAGAYVLKPGETKFSAGGKVLATGTDRAYGGLVQDEDGNWVNMRPNGGAGGTGAGAGGKGKAPATTEATAQKMLDDLFEKNGKDLPPEARARAGSFLPAVLQNNPSIQPAVATRVAFEAALSPNKNLQLDPRTGAPSLMYQNPEIDGGKPFVLAGNAGSIEDMEKQYGGKAQMKKAVEGMLANQPGTKTGELIKRAAGDPEFQKALEEKIGNPADVKVLRQKIELAKRYGLSAAPASAGAPAAPAAGTAPAAAPAPTARERLTRNLGLSSAYVPPEGSPAARAQAARSSAAEQQQQREAARASEQQKISSEFQADLKSLPPIELVRKYDTLRGKLTPADLQALKTTEQKI